MERHCRCGGLWIPSAWRCHPVRICEYGFPENADCERITPKLQLTTDVMLKNHCLAS